MDETRATSKPPVWFGVLVVLVLGIVLGYKMDTPEKEYRIVPKTVTETVTKTETVTVRESIPASCTKMIEVSDKLARAAVDMDNYSSQTLDLMSRARVSANNGSDLNAIETELRRVMSETLHVVTIIGETEDRYANLKKQCNKELED